MKVSNRKRFILTAATLATGLAVSASSSKKIDNNYPVVHHVFFWLKNPGLKEDLEKLIAGLKTLSQIETVRQLKVGIVADTKKRDVVDNSWSVSELMFFSDLAGQAVYQTHPLHLAFIKNCGHLWEKVIVYDAIDA